MPRFVCAVLALCSMVTFAARAEAAEIKVLCSNGLRAVMQDVLPIFQRESGHTVAIDFGPAAVLQQRIEGGEPFDLAILTPDAIATLIAANRAAAATRTPLARSPLGLAMKAGARPPVIASVADLTRTLRDARSITWATQGASAKPFQAILERLGLTAEMMAKFKPHETGAQVGEAVASGEVEYGVIPVSEILPVAGAALAGVFPSDVQSEILMVAAVASNAREPRAAAELIRFAAAPARAPLLEARGMQRP